MITRVRDDQYLNIFEVAWLFLTAEFVIAMNCLKLYDIETDEWHLRRIFWTVVGIVLSIPLIGALALCAGASFKYLW